MKCKDHPKYQGKMMPRAYCLECWKIYRDNFTNEVVSKAKRIDNTIKALENRKSH